MKRSNRQTIKRFVRDYRLTMAETLYHLLDFLILRQTYIQQKLGGPPRYSRLHKFLNFWEAEPERKLHSVKVSLLRLVKAHEVRHTAALL